MTRRLPAIPATLTALFGLWGRCPQLGTAIALTLTLIFTASGAALADDGGVTLLPERPSLLQRAWGVGEPGTVNLGMWTRHVDRPGIDNDALFGGTFRGVFIGTFKNSWHDRSYVLGIERRIFRREAGPLSFDAAYRVGVIQGYDERMIAAAGKIPVVPFVEPVANLLWKDRFGVQAGFCVKVVTWGAIVRF